MHTYICENPSLLLEKNLKLYFLIYITPMTLFSYTSDDFIRDLINFFSFLVLKD